MAIGEEMASNLAQSFKDEVYVEGYKDLLQKMKGKGLDPASLKSLAAFLVELAKIGSAFGITDTLVAASKTVLTEMPKLLLTSMPGVGTVITVVLEKAAVAARDYYKTAKSDELQKFLKLDTPPDFNVYKDSKKIKEDIDKIYSDAEDFAKEYKDFTKSAVSTPAKSLGAYKAVWGDYLKVKARFCHFRNTVYTVHVFAKALNQILEDLNTKWAATDAEVMANMVKSLQASIQAPPLVAKDKAASGKYILEIKDSTKGLFFEKDLKEAVAKVTDAKAKAFLTSNLPLIEAYLAMLGYADDGFFQGSLRIWIALEADGQVAVFADGKGRTSGSTAGYKLTKEAKDGWVMNFGTYKP